MYTCGNLVRLTGECLKIDGQLINNRVAEDQNTAPFMYTIYKQCFKTKSQEREESRRFFCFEFERNIAFETEKMKCK